MSAIALAAGICTSCQKETEPSPDPGTSGGQVTVIATISDGGTKVSYSESGSNLNQSWTAGDHIVGWDASGKKIELEIKDESMIKDGKAIFTPVTGSAAVPSSGKVYMIYAPGKSYTDVSEKSLTYNLSSQDGSSVPALMTATGSVSNNVLALNFTNRLAIVAVKNPTFPVTAATNITGLQLSGDNILTKATFSLDSDGELQMNSSELGAITKACNFTTATDGKTSETMVYFAVLPNSTPADVTVSTTAPTGYQISFPGKSFTAGQCYMLTQSEINKQKFAITVQSGITNGTITTDPSGSVEWGTEVTVTATPETGYELTPNSITVTDAGSGSVTVNANKFTMPQSDVTVSGTFQKKDYAITADGTPTSGTYTVTGGTYTVEKSSTAVTTAQMSEVITVTPAPTDGYSGGTVTVTETTSGNNVTVTGNTFTMPAADVTITVTFTHVLYSIISDVTPASSGNVSFKKSGSTDGITQAYYGEEITVTDTPNTDYELVSIKWKEEGGSDTDITSTKTFTMPASNVTVTTTFAKKSFDITKTDVTVTGGSFKVKKGDDEVTSAQWGETIKVEVTTEPQYYAVDEIKVYKTGDTSVPVSVNADGTFTMPKYAVTIEVSFTPDGSAPPTEMPETIGL